ncbi:MAG: hypothetical protein AVDCRST_MAG93-9009, partial [uncultured Chloroflexia bacterium]
WTSGTVRPLLWSLPSVAWSSSTVRQATNMPVPVSC